MQKVTTINLNDAFIYLMEIRSKNALKYEEKLTFQEKIKLESIKHPSKRLEYCASRYLKHLYFGDEEISYLEHGTPVLEQTSLKHGKHFSISHSKTFTAIGLNDIHPFAIDLELISDKALRLGSKFCSENERDFFDMTSEKEMTLLWSMKEVLYKLSDRNGLDFKRDITIYKVDNRYFGEVLLANGKLKTELLNFELNGFYLTCNQTYTLLHAHS